MPGYLTSMAVLIEADKWLERVETAISAKDIFTRTKLDDTVLDLAHKVRNDYLRFSYAVTPEGMPPHAKTKDDMKVGGGLSQYAFAGSLGPDIPAASNILAMNQRWVADTMHKGSPRRGWRNAHTTEFVLYSPNNINGVIRNPSNQVFTDLEKLYTTLRIGHLASVATHVIMQPYIKQWAWTNAGEQSTIEKILPWPLAGNVKPGNPVKFGVQLDAKIAQGYFQADDLHSGPWTDYLPDEDGAITFICECYREAFSAVYGTDRPIATPDQKNPAAILPRERICDVPPLTELTKAFQGLDQLVKRYPQLKNKLAHWTGWPLGKASANPVDLIKHLGYGDLFTEDDTDATEEARKEINAAVDKIDGLQSKLTDYTCSTPLFDLDFLKDGYKNTKNWALGSGYSHSRPWIISLIMTGAIPLMSANPIRPADDATGIVKAILGILGFGVTVNVWSNTIAFGGTDKDSKNVREENRKAWIDNGLDNEIIWFDMFSSADGASSLPMFFYGFFFTGFLFFDGTFGQNAGALAGLPQYHPRKIYKLTNDVLIPYLVVKLIQDLAVDWYRKTGVRWTIYWTSFVLGVLEQFWILKPDPAIGRQGDAFGLRVWYLQLWLSASFVLSSALAFGVKAGDPRDNPDRDPKAREYLLGLVFPLVLVAAIVWWRSGFEGAMLESVVGIAWPDNSTDQVDALVAVGERQVNGKKVKFLRDDAGTPQPVALFKTSALKSDEEMTPDGQTLNNLYYPEADPTTKFEDRPEADEKARQDSATHATSQTYTFKKLFDRAAMFTGLLAMALVNYEHTDADKKALAGAIFNDWNLEFRAEDEWTDLMETRADGTPGFLKAAEQWSSAISAPDQASVVQMEIAMGLKAGPAQITGQVEDRSAAPNNSRSDTAHIYLADTAYEIVDGSGTVVASGTTDKSGGFQASLPGPAEYELRIAGYQGIG